MAKRNVPYITSQIGETLARRRVLLGFTQEQLAGRVNDERELPLRPTPLTAKTVSAYETGRQEITASDLYRLCFALNVPFGYFNAGLKDTVMSASGDHTIVGSPLRFSRKR